jgi:hypothetical protein
MGAVLDVALEELQRSTAWASMSQHSTARRNATGLNIMLVALFERPASLPVEGHSTAFVMT